MAGLYEADLGKPMPDIGRKLWNIDSFEIPFLSKIKMGESLKNMLTSWETEELEDRGLGGVKDGEAVTSFDHVAQAVLEGYGMHQRESWKVTKVASLTESAGVKKQKAHQSMNALRHLRVNMERAALLDREMQLGSSSAQYIMRGVFKWLSATAQTLKPVPEAFRPTSSQWHSAALSGLTETVFEDTMMGAAYEQLNGAELSLDGFVGRILKGKMSKWAQLVTVSSQAATLSRNIDVKAHNHDTIINVFDFETGQVRNHLTNHLLRNTSSGATTNYTSRSGAFLNLKCWAKRFMQEPRRFELENDGSGPNGYADALWILTCLNPKGQLAVKASS